MNSERGQALVLVLFLILVIIIVIAALSSTGGNDGGAMNSLQDILRSIFGFLVDTQR